MSSKRQAKKNETKKQNQANAVTKKVEEKVVEKKVEKPVEKKNEQPKAEPVQTTIYSMSAIVYTVVIAVSVVLSMIMWIKPGYYYLETLLGKTLDFYTLDLAYEVSFTTLLPKEVGTMFVVIGILCIISTILAIVMVARTMKATNKPITIASILCMIFAVAAVALFFVCDGKMHTAFTDSGMPDIYEVQKSFGIYYATCIALIVNAVVAFVHMIMSFVNTSIWKKTGKVK